MPVLHFLGDITWWGAKARLKVADKEMKDLKWEHEVLEQRFSKVQDERDELYQKFIKAIHEVQQKSGFKNLLLERKLHALTDTLEKKEVQLNEVLSASNLDPTALTVVTRKLEDILDSKNSAIKDLQYELARVCKAHNDLLRTYETKLRAFGIPVDELGFKPLESTVAGQTLGVTKWDIRKKVWDYIEDNNLANFPRPVHNRIPNFKGASQAAEKLTGLEEFRTSKTIKVNPDKPQQQARFLTLDGAYQACDSIKGLEVFNKTCGVKVDPDKPLEGVRLATLQGVKEYSVPIGLDAKVQVDLVVVGSVAVSEKGWRIGKGEGFADMEYAMMVSMGAVSQSTIVVTIVHDCQVVDIPEELVDTHDLTVDYILTPSKVIKTECKHPNPKGIIWSKVDLNLLGKIPILKKLREMEKEAGKDVTLKTELPGATENPSSAEDKGAQDLVGSGNNKDFHSVRKTETTRPDGITTVYIGNIPQNLSVREFKTVLREHDAVPLRLNWQGAKRRAFLDYKDPGTAESVVAALKGLSITGSSIRAELAKSQRSQCNRGPAPRRPKSTEAESTAEVVDIPEELVDTHDLTVDYILTPSKVIKTECKHPNPKGIIWSKVDLNLLGKIPILKKLREMEKEAGKDVTLKTELPGATENPSSAEAEGAQAVVGSANNKDFHSVRKTETTRPDGITTVYIGNIPQNLSVREFKTVLREHDAVPLRLNWQGAKRRAFLDYKDPGTAESVVAALKGLSITGSSIRAELAKSQRSQCNRGPAPRRPKSTEAESAAEVKSLS
ncbi:Methenyltetrahydrofolate synthase domain-containing protein [Acipenser ruthenus]|uniref:Methenyltetrahydrofolate synthase domain-containing protein n=1 Tax=Acipenser ruthenus TaxID=7906 RepID=A0A444U301_ACIRT|nr:Methenyltetrahydrofolate synthase domain-containing protein [Acipenser ruthenus]